MTQIKRKQIFILKRIQKKFKTWFLKQ